jgi:hypothetical protein
MKKVSKFKIITNIFIFLLLVMMLYSNCWGLELLKVPGTSVFMKVVGVSDNINATSEKGSGRQIFSLDVLKPYFVLTEEGEYYKITDRQSGGRTGYVSQKDVMQWNTREGLRFAPSILAMEDRPKIQAWEDLATISDYISTGNQKKYGPAYEESALRSRILSAKRLRPYPIILQKKIKIPHEDMYKTIYNVMIPTSIPESKVMIHASPEQIKESMSSVVFCVIFDATGSMSPFATNIANTIEELISTIGAKQDNASVGFIFYRDIEDSKPYWVENPMSMKNGIEILKAVKCDGGGDGAEPVLDAVYISTTSEFIWGNDSGQSGAKKIAIVVLNTDAKPETIGLSDTVAKGIGANEVANVLMRKDIRVYALQADSSDEGHLISTLTKLANVTGGEFYGADSSTIEIKRHFSGSIKRLMKTTLETEYKSGEVIYSKIESKDGLSVIPLKVLNEEKLNRLREIGKVDISRGGLYIQEGWMFENQDIYQKQILIDKETLESIVRFFSIMGNVTADVEALKKSAQKNLEAMLGEKIPNDAELQELIEKRLGINFNKNLLAFNLEWFSGLVPKERMSLQKRIQIAGDKLGSFLESNTPEFNKEPMLWMSMSYLP